MSDRTDRVIVRWSPTGRAPRRIVFEPVESGGWNRIEQAYSDDRGWRTVGSERVESIGFEGPVADHHDDYPGEATPAQTHLGDPRVDDDQTALDENDSR